MTSDTDSVGSIVVREVERDNDMSKLVWFRVLLACAERSQVRRVR
jgi:hypothetical protein